MDRRGWTLIAGSVVVVAALSWRARIDDGAAQGERSVAPSATKVEAPATPEVAREAQATTGSSDLLAALANDTAPSLPPPPLPVSSEPLPPWDAKLVDVLPALKARADAGDHVAACHIGLALSACAMALSYAPSKAEIRQVDP